MQAALNQFIENIKTTQNLGKIYEYLKNDQKIPMDLSDLLRSQYVYAVSALDKFVHEIIRIGMLESFDGKRAKTMAYENFTISAKTMAIIQEKSIKKPAIIDESNDSLPFLYQPEGLPSYYFEQEILLKHKTNAYQDPKKIADGLSLIWSEPYKWQKIAASITNEQREVIKEDRVKQTLENIVQRRNQIVHEADINPLNNEKNDIELKDAGYSVAFIQKIGIAIFEKINPS
jgi:hypothetical protein